MKANYFFLSLALTSSVFAQTYDDHQARDKRIEDLINLSEASKCADGSAKIKQEMGYVSGSYDRPYMAKSNEQVFVTIIPRPEGNRVTLYYCPVRNIYTEKGVQKSVIVPLTRYSYNLGQLRKSDYCDFSDILNGSVGLLFQGAQSYYNINLRPVMGSASEQAEYKKLCSNKPQSSKVQDVVCLPGDQSQPTKLATDVAATLKKRYSCDMRDLISGGMTLGAGISVNVDDINKNAEIATLGVYPGAKEKVDSILKQQEGTSRFELKTDNAKESFELLDTNTGIYTRSYKWNGQSGTTTYKCILSK